MKSAPAMWWTPPGMSTSCWASRRKTASCLSRWKPSCRTTTWAHGTIYPFVSGNGNDSDAVFAAISQLQPGALLGNSALLLSADTDDQSIIDWARELGLGDQAAAPEAGQGSTVATAQVPPGEQQVLYLWEEGNAPATTEYTVNNGSYFDDPDFRPYLTSYPVPDGVEIKGRC